MIDLLSAKENCNLPKCTTVSSLLRVSVHVNDAFGSINVPFCAFSFNPNVTYI